MPHDSSMTPPIFPHVHPDAVRDMPTEERRARFVVIKQELLRRDASVFASEPHWQLMDAYTTPEQLGDAPFGHKVWVKVPVGRHGGFDIIRAFMEPESGYWYGRMRPGDPQRRVYPIAWAYIMADGIDYDLE